jgi:hypothetical protein
MSHTISGRVEPAMSGFFGGSPVLPAVKAANLNVSWTGTSSGNTRTDAEGNYSIPGLADGTYVVTPDRSFPISLTIVVAGADVPGVDFFLAGPIQGKVQTWDGKSGEILFGDGSTVANFSINDIALGRTIVISVGANVRFMLDAQVSGGAVQINKNAAGTVTGAQIVGGTLTYIGHAIWVSEA